MKYSIWLAKLIEVANLVGDIFHNFGMTVHGFTRHSHRVTVEARCGLNRDAERYGRQSTIDVLQR
jgi:hypothetical protein